VDLFQIALLWADTLILGAFFPPRIPGIYRVATGAVLLTSVGIGALNLVIAPYLARSLRTGGRSVNRMFDLGARWTILLTFLPFVLILPIRRELLLIFGERYLPGLGALTILMAGFMFNAVCGPIGVLLNMSGLSHLVLLNTALTVGLNVALNLAFDRRFGMPAAAAAWSISLLLVNVLNLFQVRSRLHVSVFGPLQISAAIAFGSAAVLTWLASFLGPGIGVGAAILSLSLATWITRAREEEEWALAALKRWRQGSPLARGR
jgi:O-antigen/teichoic acid export membrane protein